MPSTANAPFWIVFAFCPILCKIVHLASPRHTAPPAGGRAMITVPDRNRPRKGVAILYGGSCAFF